MMVHEGLVVEEVEEFKLPLLYLFNGKIEIMPYSTYWNAINLSSTVGVS